MTDSGQELQNIRGNLDAALASADALGETLLAAKLTDALVCVVEIIERLAL